MKRRACFGCIVLVLIMAIGCPPSNNCFMFNMNVEPDSIVLPIGATGYTILVENTGVIDCDFEVYMKSVDGNIEFGISHFVLAPHERRFVPISVVWEEGQSRPPEYDTVYVTSYNHLGIPGTVSVPVTIVPMFPDR